MTTSTARLAYAGVFLPLAVAACAPEVDLFGPEDGGAGGSGLAAGVGGGSTATNGPSGPATTSVSGTGGAGATAGAGGGPCITEPDEDADGDAYSSTRGDCNDCDPLIGPSSIEIQGNVLDEDCDGNLNNVLESCDRALAVDDDDPVHAAQAAELCKQSQGKASWGLVGASWTLADGSAPVGIDAYHLGHGLLDDFGPNVAPRAGQRLLALSSGAARRPTDPGYQSPSGLSKGYQGNPPAGFPKADPSCPGVTSGAPSNPIGLEVTVVAPANAQGFSFDFDLYAWDWPTYVCSAFSDTFVAMLSPIPPGLSDGNVSFDALGNTFSLNGAPFDVCSCPAPPCLGGGKSFDCAQGDGQLAGTGFEEHAATGWQRTVVPIAPGETFVLRWAIYDATDGIADSTVLVDGFAWSTGVVSAVATAPVP